MSSNWITEMSFLEMFDFNVYNTANSDTGNVGEYVTQKTQDARSNSFQQASFYVERDDEARRQLSADQESLLFPIREYVEIPSQLSTNGLGALEAEASQQTRDGYRSLFPSQWTQMYPVSQASGSDSSGLTQSGTIGHSFISQLSIPSEQQEDGGNSHLPEDDIAQPGVDSEMDFWEGPHKFNSYNDVIMSRPMFQFNQSKNNSRRRSGTAASPDHALSHKKSAHVRGEPALNGFPGLQRTVNDRKLRRHAAAGSNDAGNFGSSLQSPGLAMGDSSPDGAHRGAFMGKRKRADVVPETILEGIFIVTRRPNNGKMSRIADFIDWDFKDVNEWFDSRAQWEASRTSSSRSQNTNVHSTSSTINILPQDLEDSGFFELPDNPTVARRPKKRIKHHTTLVSNKPEDENDHEDKMEMKTYHCIHETCSHSFAKFGEWKRHMASVHYPDRWACLLEEEGQVLPTDCTCSSCETSFESVRDLKEHMHLSTRCQDTNFVCVFDRKDKLGSHWKKCHEFESRFKHLGDEDLCKREIRDFDPKCGFCELSFTNWDNKIEHVGTHFKDEGLKMSSWRYPHYKDERTPLRRPLIDGQDLPGDQMFDTDADNSDADDSDDSDDDDVGDRPKLHVYNRRNDRDRDKDGNSGSGTFFPPPPNDDHAGSGGSSSQDYSYDARYGKSHNVRNNGFSARKGEADAREKSLTAEYSHSHNVPLFSFEAMPAFKSIRILGHGGFGSVDEICIEGTNQIVARKRIHRFPGQARNFTIELEMIRKLRALDHPHIVRFLGSYITDTHIDVLMSPVADYDLNEFMLQQYPPVPIAVKTSIAGFYGCLVSALNYIHERDIRHRDIKPKNILIANGVILIADFGSAIDTNHEVRNESIGITPKYTAPEVFSNGRHARASDVWSLGCVFVELATIVHDKTLFELETFRSPNAKFNTVQPFHETTGKLNDWLKVLPRLSATPSPTCQEIRHLETISKMLQYDEIKRPSASELLPRFPPSYCCSMATSSPKFAFPSIPSDFLEFGRKDRISLAISRSWEDNPFHEIAKGTDFRQSLIECSDLGRKVFFEAAEVVRILCYGRRSKSDETKKNTSSESKPAVLSTHVRPLSHNRSGQFVGLSPKVLSTIVHFASVNRLNEKSHKLFLQKTMECERREDSIERSYPTSISMGPVSIDGNSFIQLNYRTSKDSPAIIGVNEQICSPANDNSDIGKRESACDGRDIPLVSGSHGISVSDLGPLLLGDYLDEPISNWFIIKPQYPLLSLAIGWQTCVGKSIYSAPFFDQARGQALLPPHAIVGASDIRAANMVLKEVEGVNDWAVVDGDGTTLLHLAICMGNYELVHLLINRGGDIEAKSDDAPTPTPFRRQYMENLRWEVAMNGNHGAYNERRRHKIKCHHDVKHQVHGICSHGYTNRPLQAAEVEDNAYAFRSFAVPKKDHWQRQWVIEETVLQNNIRQIRNYMQTEAYDPAGQHIEVLSENVLKHINGRETFERYLDSRLSRRFIYSGERSEASGYRKWEPGQFLRSGPIYWWKEHFPAGTGTFLPLSGSEKFPVPKWNDIKDKIKALYEFPENVVWRHDLDNWNVSRHKDDQLGHDKALSTSTKCYLAILSLPHSHKDWRHFTWVDCLDGSTAHQVEEYRRDPSIDWSRLRPDRNDVGNDDNQLQIIFHWWKCPHEKPAGPYEKSAGPCETFKGSNDHGHGNDFIQIFMGTPERVKEIKGCWMTDNSPNSNGVDLDFCLSGSDFGLVCDHVLVIALVSSNIN